MTNPEWTPSTSNSFAEASRPALYKAGHTVLRQVGNMALGVEVIGAERIPRDSPGIIAVTHESMADPFVIAPNIPRPVLYIGKEDIKRNRVTGPIIDWFIQNADVLMVDRNNFASNSEKANAFIGSAVSQLKDRGRLATIHNEGRVNTEGGVLVSKSGVARIAYESQVPTYPAAIVGTRWGIASILEHAAILLFGEPLDPPESPSGASRKAFKAALHASQTELRNRAVAANEHRRRYKR